MEIKTLVSELLSKFPRPVHLKQFILDSYESSFATKRFYL